MATTIDIDFKELDQNISQLKNLLSEMEEPSYDKVEFWLSGVGGSGMVRDYLTDFYNDTINFHNDVYKLIQNTIAYLESIKKLKTADENIANSL